MEQGQYHLVKLDAAEYDTVLAALACYQQVWNQCEGDLPDDLLEITTNNDEHSPLESDELDELIERLTGSDPVVDGDHDIHLTEEERGLALEAAYRLQEEKREAFKVVDQEVPRMESPFTERDFGIPQIEGLIKKLEGA